MTAVDWYRGEAEGLRGLRSGVLLGTPASATALGLHITDGELAIQRDRVDTDGPYTAAGNVSTNSPNDWGRIVTNKDGLLANPDTAYVHPTAEVPSGTAVWFQGSWHTQSFRVRDAAYWALNRALAEPVAAAAAAGAAKTWLLNQAGTSKGTDWKNIVLWPGPTHWVDANPMVQVCEWLTSLLYGFDYLLAYEAEGNGAVFTSGEKDTLLAWFYDAADYWQWEQNRHVNNFFGGASYTTGRWADPPAYDAVADVLGKVCWLESDGAEVWDAHFMRILQNRKTQVFRYVTVAGLLLEREGFTPTADPTYGYEDGGSSPGRSVADLKRHGLVWVRDVLAFYLDPVTGLMGDHERWTTANPILGWTYSAAVIGTALDICEALARAGDSSAYDWSSTNGQHQTAGGPKTAETLLEHFLMFAAEEYDRYGTDVPGNIGNADYQIKSHHNVGGANYDSVNDLTVGVASGRFATNELFRRCLLRDAGGTYLNIPGYPASPTDSGYYGWMGAGRVFPGVLFMFAHPDIADPAAWPNPYPAGA